MTIDERLERLTDRHVALTQTVEIIAGMQTAGEKQMEEVRVALKDLSVTMNRLANIVIRHEERLDHLDGGE